MWAPGNIVPAIVRCAVVFAQQLPKKARSASGYSCVKLTVRAPLTMMGIDGWGRGMPSIREIGFALTGLLLAGCMQSGTLAPRRTLISPRAIGRNWRTHPINRRRFHRPISVRSFNTTAGTARLYPGRYRCPVRLLRTARRQGDPLRRNRGESWSGSVRRGHSWSQGRMAGMDADRG